MKRSLRKQVSVLLAGAMAFTTVLAQTSAFAENAGAENVDVTEAEEVSDATATASSIVSSVKAADEVVTEEEETAVIKAEVAVPEDENVSDAAVDALAAGTGFQVKINAGDKTTWKVDDTFTADLLFNRNAADKDMVGINNFTVALTYDSTQVELADAADGDIVYDYNGTSYKLLTTGRVKKQFENAAEKDGMKTVILAAVAGLPDDGVNITAADKNYKAEGTKLATLTFKVVATGGVAPFEMNQYSEKSVLNTLDVHNEIVPYSNVELLGDEIALTEKVAAPVNFELAFGDYDLGAKAVKGIFSVNGKLKASQRAGAGENEYDIVLKNDADIDGLVAAASAATATNVTCAKAGDKSVKINYKDADNDVTYTLNFSSTDTEIKYEATDGKVSVKLAGGKLALTSSYANSVVAADTNTIKLADGADPKAAADTIAEALNKCEYVTATVGTLSEAADGTKTIAVTVKFEKAADYDGIKHTKARTDTKTVTFTAAKAVPAETVTKFTVSGKDNKNNEKSVEVSITVDGSKKVTAKTANGVAITLPETDGMVVVPVDFDFSALKTVSGQTVAKDAKGRFIVTVDGIKIWFVRFGDVNFDGKVNAVDFAQVKAQARKILKPELTGVALTLADVAAPYNNVNAVDFAQVKAAARNLNTDAFPAEKDALKR